MAGGTGSRAREVTGALVLVGLVLGLAAIALWIGSSSDDAVARMGDPPWEERVVRVEATGCGPTASTGSGTVVNAVHGLVLTAAHVVAGAERVSVAPTGDAEGNGAAADVVALDAGSDLALLEVADVGAVDPDPAGGPAAGLRLTDPVEGGTYSFVGFSGGSAEPRTAQVVRKVEVVVSDADGELVGRRDGLEVAARVDEGDSGAILFDRSGQAAGMLFAASDTSPERAWAVSTVEIAAFLEAASTEGSGATGGTSGPVATGTCAP